MVIFRAAAYVLLIAAFVLVVMDGMRSLAANALVLTPLGQVWFNLHADSLAKTQAWAEHSFAPALIKPMADMALSSPGWLIPLVLSFLLALIGRKRRTGRRWIGEVE